MNRSFKIYPYVQLNEHGKVTYTGAHTWNQGVPGSVDERGCITLNLPPIEINLPVSEDMTQQALEFLRQHRTDATAKHHALMTRLQFAENQLLRLSSPDIIDAVDVRYTPRASETDDDIPF